MHNPAMSIKEIPLLIPVDHPAFAGHFPDMPIVPGVVLLDEVLYALGRDAELDQKIESLQISNVKFLSPMKPGESALIKYARNANGSITFEIVDGERQIVSGSLAIAS